MTKIHKTMSDQFYYMSDQILQWPDIVSGQFWNVILYTASGTVPSTHMFTLTRECYVCRAQVQIALDTSVTQILIYGIATDDYVLKLYVFVPAVLL